MPEISIYKYCFGFTRDLINIYTFSKSLNITETHLYISLHFNWSFAEVTLLKLLGTTVKICGSRLLIVRCDAARLPRLHGDVFNRRLRPIGRVVDIFGNVSSPYAAVFCRGDHAPHTGEKLYTKGDGKWQKSRN